jgi:hypothetical protein
MVDVLVSRGMPGHPPRADAPPVDLYFSNPDMLWKNEWPAPRFGQGAFAACLQALYEQVRRRSADTAEAGSAGCHAHGRAALPCRYRPHGMGCRCDPFTPCCSLPRLWLQVAGEPLRARFFGKPHPEPYGLVERLLVQQAHTLGLELPTPAAAAADDSQAAAGDGAGQQPPPFSAVYAVGDNPAADVRGANAAGSPWVSVLVTETGVARANCSTDPAQASHAAHDAVPSPPAGSRTGVPCTQLCVPPPCWAAAQVVVADVEAAVEAALHRTRSLRWHSMR